MLHAPPVTDPADLPRLRDVVVDALSDVHPDQRERVVLAVSELVTNALIHAGAAAGVRVGRCDGTVRIEVDDPSPRPPAPREAAPHDVGGRGLQIVDVLAERWGIDPAPVGKTVWCEIAA